MTNLAMDFYTFITFFVICECISIFIVSILLHYNKRCPYTPSDFIKFWMNSLIIVNKDQWKNSEFTGLLKYTHIL